MKNSGIKHKLAGSLAAMALSLGAYSGLAFGDDNIKMTLVGSEETPPIMTKATGSGTITVKSDMSVSGSVTTTGMTGTMAHIHQGAIGVAGPPIITLAKSGDDTWMVPAGAKLTDAQYKAYKDGNLYINVHSAAHPAGEVRGQMKQP